MTDTYELDLVRRMASCLESGKYSDLTIICRGHEFHVHRAILCTASKFFQAACDGEFKVSHLNNAKAVARYDETSLGMLTLP